MKPDPDMMSRAFGISSDALEAIGKFQTMSGFHFGRDARHSSAYQHIRNLADALHVASAKLNQNLLDTDDRLEDNETLNYHREHGIDDIG
jgi:hypothetical protein